MSASDWIEGLETLWDLVGLALLGTAMAAGALEGALAALMLRAMRGGSGH